MERTQKNDDVNDVNDVNETFSLRRVKKSFEI